MTYSTIPNDKLRALCIKNNWFTCGSNAQYDKLFEGNTSGFTAEEIATIIWLCSANADRNAILNTLKSERTAWTQGMISIPAKSSAAKAGYLAEIEEAATLQDLLNIRSRFTEDLSIPYEDVTDCLNAFKLKRAELPRL